MKSLKKIFSQDKSSFILLGILVAAFLIRLIYLFQFRDTVFFDPLLMDKHDQKTFMLWARQILEHPWYVDGKIFYMAPLYPYFLALLLFLLSGSLMLVISFQLLMDTAVCGFLFYLGRKIHNKWTGYLAAFLACFYRTSVVYASSVLSDSLIFFLYIFFIFLVYRSMEKKTVASWVSAGIVLGLAALSKPTIAVYLPFLLAGLYAYPGEKLPRTGLPVNLQPILAILILVASSAMVILPVTLRNFYVGGELVPICTNGMVNWQIGNSSDSIGLFYYPRGELLSPFSAAFWRLFLTKLNIFFTSYEWPQNLNVYLVEDLIPFLKTAFVKFGFVLPAGIAGTILMMRDWRRNFIFVSYALVNVLWVVLFFVVDRYRLPAAGCFMVSAAFLVVWTLESMKKKSILLPALLWAVAGAFAYFYDITPGQRVPSASVETFAALSVKNIQNDLSTGRMEAALEKAETYRRFLPDDFRSSFMLACVLSGMGRNEAAAYYLEETLRINPEFVPGREFLESIRPE